MSTASEQSTLEWDDVDYSKDPFFYKYCSDDKAVIKGVFEDHRIRFTQPAALNDPLEFRPAIRFGPKRTDRFVNTDKFRSFVHDGVEFPDVVSWLRNRAEQKQLRRYGVLSLTKVSGCFDMWSRYANGHKGFLLTLRPDFNKLPCMCSKDGHEHEVRAVDYAEPYDIDVKGLLNEGGEIPADAWEELVFFHKNSRWAHEREYRMVRPLAECVECRPRHRPHWKCVCLFDFPMESIASVRFGACMTVANKKRITAACKGLNIEFLQSLITTDSSDRWGRPGRMDVVPIEDIPDFLRRDNPWITQMGGSLEMVQGPIPVDALSKLPYYSGNRRRIKRYYESKRHSAIA
jgi:hypothetical protein